MMKSQILILALAYLGMCCIGSSSGSLVKVIPDELPQEEGTSLSRNGGVVQPKGERFFRSLPPYVSCGTHFLPAGSQVRIKSRRHPSPFPRRNFCLWNFMTSEGSSISINCSVFELLRCWASSVLMAGEGLWGRYCSTRTDGVEASSNNNQLRVLFRSKYNRRARGFKCVVTASGSVGATTTTPGSVTTPTTVQPAADGCVCGKRNTVTKIVGGNPATLHEYPWQAAIVPNNGNQPFCGGSIISDQWILTAAHCLPGETPSSIDVIVGEHDWTTNGETTATTKHDVQQIILHPNYNSDTQDNDIALIRLSTPITFDSNNRVAPICLPSDSSLDNNDPAVVTGWGVTSSGGSQPPQLYEVEINTWSDTSCNNAYPFQITSNMLCAGVSGGGRDSCQGDSGGPLVTNANTAGTYMALIGVVSWGNGCALAGSPGVYTRVSNYLTWIQSTAGSLNTCPPPS